jgi:hypothetical protein
MPDAVPTVGASSPEPVQLPRGGGRPKRGPTKRPRYSKRTREFVVREREKRKTIKARSTHRVTYESDYAARRQYVAERESYRQQTAALGELNRRGTQKARANEQIRVARERARLQGGGGGLGVFGGFIRILAVIIGLSLLFLVLSNPGPSSGIVGGFGDLLYRFTTSTEPLFRTKAASK